MNDDSDQSSHHEKTMEMLCNPRVLDFDRPLDRYLSNPGS